jgi:hypothetical protein
MVGDLPPRAQPDEIGIATRVNGSGVYGVITPGWRIFLVLLSAVFFSGAGAALALWKLRRQTTEVPDFSALGAGVVFFFASVLLIPAAGVLAVPALGAVVAWVGYLVAAQRRGLFAVETGRPEPQPRPVRRAPPPAR